MENMDNMNMENMGTEKKSNGAFIGSIIIIIIIIIGGIYIWQSKVKSALEEKTYQEENVVPADTTDLNNLEQDLSNIDTTLDIDLDTLN